jgi:flavodoxin
VSLPQSGGKQQFQIKTALTATRAVIADVLELLPPYSFALPSPPDFVYHVRMKTAIVYYSYEGNCACIAERIKAALPDAELVRLSAEDDKARGAFAKYVWGGKQVFTHAKPKLRPYSLDVNLYDLLIIGTPVWAWSYSPALGTFLSETKIEGKKIALFCCHGGGPGRTLEKLKNALPGNTFVGRVDFREPLKRQEGVQDKLNRWIAGFTG